MALDDPLVWLGRILRPNHIFTFLCVWAELDGYVRRTLDSPFLVFEECNRPLDEETITIRFKEVWGRLGRATYGILISM
jgi:hypothetical protein